MARKMLKVFVKAIHDEIISWAPKPRFVFSDFWHTLGIKEAQQVVLEGDKEKLEVNVAEIAWDKDGAVCVTYPDVIHQFKLEYGHINYMKVTTSADGDENDSFNTKLFQE